MPRHAVGLSAAKVTKAGPSIYVDGAGLRLVVKSTGARSWVFRYTVIQRTREMGLGGAGTGAGCVSLAEARRRVSDLRREMRTNVDPLATRDAEIAAARAAAQVAAIQAITFRSVAEFCIKAHAAGWKNPKHKAQWASTLDAYVHPTMGDLPVEDVAASHVLAVLEPIWQTKSETATRVRGLIEVILDYARVRDWRTGENPARWRVH